MTGIVTQAAPAPTARETALMKALVDHVAAREATVRQETGDRLHEIEQIVVACRDAQGDLSEALQRLSDAATGPVENARALLRQVRTAVDAAEDASAVVRRWARSHLLSRARDLS